METCAFVWRLAARKSGTQAASRRPDKILAASILIAVFLLLWLPMPAVSQVLPLMGETFAGTLFIHNISPLTCPSGGELRFESSGAAAGPYPGTFVENGTLRGAMFSAFNADFQIDGAFDVTGTKSGTVSVSCERMVTGPPMARTNRTIIEFSGQVSYNAPGLPDSGMATVSGRFMAIRTPSGVETRSGTFNQTFILSTLGPPAAVVLDPAAAANDVGTTHTITASVFDALGRPLPGIEVSFVVEGSVSDTGFCTTDSTGRCEFAYQGPQFPGADSITGFVDRNQNHMLDIGEPFGEATKAWVLPASTPGQVTGGGQIDNLLVLNAVAFGFNAQFETDKGFHGHCNVVDREAKTHIKCLDVEALVVTGTHTTIFGRATVNGTEARYRIDVDDLEEPGPFVDTFSIITENGYGVGGVVTKGNIQIHP
jgi:hypothetical protein